MGAAEACFLRLCSSVLLRRLRLCFDRCDGSVHDYDPLVFGAPWEGFVRASLCFGAARQLLLQSTWQRAPPAPERCEPEKRPAPRARAPSESPVGVASRPAAPTWVLILSLLRGPFALSRRAALRASGAACDAHRQAFRPHGSGLTPLSAFPSPSPPCARTPFRSPSPGAPAPRPPPAAPVRRVRGRVRAPHRPGRRRAAAHRPRSDPRRRGLLVARSPALLRSAPARSADPADGLTLAAGSWLCRRSGRPSGSSSGGGSCGRTSTTLPRRALFLRFLLPAFSPSSSRPASAQEAEPHSAALTR